MHRRACSICKHFEKHELIDKKTVGRFLHKCRETFGDFFIIQIVVRLLCNALLHQIIVHLLER